MDEVVFQVVCGHDEMQMKVDNVFNNPFSVRSLLFKKRGESW